MSVLLLILGLLLFVGLVVVHELGHFIVARRNGVEVEEFGIGFPPRAWTRKTKSGFLFSINWLPLGGFVKLKGEHDSDTKPGTYGAANLWAKTKIMLAGVAMNLLAAFVLLTILGWLGTPTIIDNQFSIPRDTKIIGQVKRESGVKVDQVMKGSPANTIGIKSGDVLLGIGGHPVNNPSEVHTLAQSHANKDTTVVFQHEGKVVTKTIKLGDGKGKDNYLGVGIESNQSGIEVRRFTWSAPIVAAGFMKQVTVLTFKGLGTAVKGLGSTIAGLVTGNKQARQAGQTNATEQVSGPIGIFEILKTGTALGYRFVLLVIAIISLTLAIINLLPIPALDGGRLFVTWLFRAARKPLKQTTEEWIHGTGFALLMVLFVLICIVDIKRILGS